MKPQARSEKCEVGQFARDGFLMVDRVLTEEECDELGMELSRILEATQASARRRLGGVRHLLQTSARVREVAFSSALMNLLRELLGTAAFPVRCIFFDKTPQANWSVPWHQDLHIAVGRKIETAGFGPWSVKEGVIHVQPPPTLLARLATVRLHLDDCDETNGALRVVPGSHANGILNHEQTKAWIGRGARTCEARQGGALVMRPLLLHASSPSVRPTHRRVLHLEYAAENLPNGLRWFERP